MSRKKTHKQYVEEVLAINSNIEVLEQYNGANIATLHRCKTHNVTWLAYPTNILRGHGCPECGNNTRKTHEQYVYEVSIINPTIEVAETYINAKTKIKHRCKIDGHIWKAYPYVILRGDGCPKCAGNAKKDTEQYIDEVANINSDVVVLGDYINMLTPILHKCKVDGHEWFAEPANILSGRGCPQCKSHILSNMFVKQHEQYIAEVSVTNQDIEVLEKYINARTPILHRCKKDGYVWKIAPSNILNGQGCPQCQESNGERKIRHWFLINNIEYIYQKTFDDCIDKKLLPFDFYIKKYNLCIEFDGRQHFEPVDFAGKGKEWALKQFEIIKHHDAIKTQYCKNNNIHLLRIPYYLNIEEELDKFFIHLI